MSYFRNRFVQSAADIFHLVCAIRKTQHCISAMSSCRSLTEHPSLELILSFEYSLFSGDYQQLFCEQAKLEVSFFQYIRGDNIRTLLDSDGAVDAKLILMGVAPFFPGYIFVIGCPGHIGALHILSPLVPGITVIGKMTPVAAFPRYPTPLPTKIWSTML